MRCTRIGALKKFQNDAISGITEAETSLLPPSERLTQLKPLLVKRYNIAIDVT